MSRTSELSSLRNLGGRSEQWLNEIGVFTRADLERIGSIEIYRLLRERDYPVSLNLVWAIEGALADIDWRDLSDEFKSGLRQQIKRR